MFPLYNGTCVVFLITCLEKYCSPNTFSLDKTYDQHVLWHHFVIFLEFVKELHSRNLSGMRINVYTFWFNIRFFHPLRNPPPPRFSKKHLLVQSRVECTAFSDPNQFFWIEYISNFFYMNEKFLLLYKVLDKPIFLNLRFYCTSRLHRANF